MIPKRIIISRTDSIGDVVLTLPMAGVIKENFPDCEVLFLGKNYTKAVIELSKYVDKFISWDELQSKPNPTKEIKKLNVDVIIHVFPNKEIAHLALKAKIPTRIGTRGRVFHLLTCNKKVAFSRRKSDLHESQLNLKLLSPLGIKKDFTFKDIQQFYGLSKTKPLRPELSKLLTNNKRNVILHPKSKGSAKEWGLDRFAELINLLPESEFKIFITGTEEEGKLIGNALPFSNSNVESLIGKLTLEELIGFIENSDALVAASTGPLHIAAAYRKRALGLYMPKRPIHPGRWKPIGINAEAIVFDENCNNCKEGKECNCISEISPQKVADLLKK